MSNDNQFWNYIAEDIKKVHKMKEPHLWNAEDIKNFQAIMIREIVPVLEKNPELQITFGAKKKGVYKSNYYFPPSAKTFQRIFKLNESRGNDKTKDQFALVFGYNSHSDYIVSKGLHTSISESPKYSIHELTIEKHFLSYLGRTTNFFKSITLEDIQNADVYLPKFSKNSSLIQKENIEFDNSDETFKSAIHLSEERKKLAIQLSFKLISFYLKEREFNSISIQADSQGKYGSLSMDDFFITPSYIPEKELKSRDSLLKSEKESSSTKIEKLKAKYFQNFLPHEYISGNLLTGLSRILITGNPGVGKSTYARWLCFSWAKQRLHIKGVLVYINLRLLQFGKTNSLSKYISNEYLKIEETEHTFQILCSLYEDMYFVLDGFDELSNKKQKQLKNDLNQISSHSRFILLSRPYGLINNPGFSWEFSIQIDGFNNSNIYNYIDKFLSINNLQNKRDHLLDIISKNRVLEDYAHTPLMLSHIAFIFLESDSPEKELLGIHSQFHLQNLVFNWIQKYESSKKLKKELTDLIDEASEFAYNMEIQKLVLIENKSIANKSKTIAEYLSFIGLGNMQTQEFNQLWRFNFNTITFQEFLSSLFLSNRITPAAFLYLSSEKYFWNFTRMIIGSLSSQGKERLIFEILALHLKSFEETKQFKHWYFYIMHLSETSSSFLNNLITKEYLTNLFSTYQVAFWDQNWRATILDATTKIYSKLQIHKKNLFKNKLINDLRQLLIPVSNQPVSNIEPTKVLITKLRLEQDMNFLQKMIVLQIESIELLLSDSSNEILEQIHEGVMFVFEEILCAAQPNELLIFNDQLQVLLNKTPDLFIIPKSKLLRHNVLHEEIISKIKFNLGKIEKIVFEQKKSDINNSFKTKLFIQDFIVDIYHLAKNITGYKQEDTLYLIKESTNLILSTFNLLDFEDYDLDELGNLLINSLLSFETHEIYDLILKVALLTRPSYLVIRASNNDEFFSYLQSLVKDASRDLSKESIDKLIMSFGVFENARNQFARIREDFSNLLCEYVDKNSEAFKLSEGGYVLQNHEEGTSKAFEITQRFNYIMNTSLFSNDIFSYDKKYLLDKFIRFHSYKFFKNWFHPMTWGQDFNIYQKTYWELILGYTNNKNDLGSLITILRNPSIYEYSSNLPYLNKILHYFLSLPQFPNNNNRLSRLIEILSRCLTLIKLRNDTKLELNTCEEECLELCAIISEKFKLQEIFIQADTPTYLEGKDLFLFILLFYYLREDKYNLNIDYDEFLNEYNRERKEFLNKLIELFTVNEKLQTQDLESINDVLGEKLVTRLKDLIGFRPELLNEFNISDFEDMLE